MHAAPTTKPEVEEQDTESPASLGSVVFSNSSLFAAGDILSLAFSFGTIILLTRTLGAEGYGIYTAAVGVFEPLTHLATFGLVHGVVRFIGLHPTRASGIIRRAAQLSFLVSALAALVFLAAIHLGPMRAVMGESTDLLALLLVGAPLVSTYWVLLASLQAQATLGPLVAVEKFARPTLRLSFAIVMLAAGGRLWAAYGIEVLVPALLVIIAYFILRRRFNLKWRGARAPGLTGNMVRFSLPLFAGGTVSSLSAVVVLLMLTSRYAAAAVGVYGVILRLSRIQFIPRQALESIISPLVARAFGRGNRDDVQRLYRLSSHWTQLLLIPVTITVIRYAPAILSVFGPEYVEGVLALRILTAMFLIDSLPGSCFSVLAMGGHSRLFLYNNLAGLAVTIIVAALLIPDLGVVGAVIAIVSRWGLISLLSVVEIAMIYRAVFWDWTTLRVLAALCITTAVAWFLPSLDNASADVLLGACLISVTFGLALLLVGGLTEDDWRELRRPRSLQLR